MFQLHSSAFCVVPRESEALGFFFLFFFSIAVECANNFDMKNKIMSVSMKEEVCVGLLLGLRSIYTLNWTPISCTSFNRSGDREKKCTQIYVGIFLFNSKQIYGFIPFYASPTLFPHSVSYFSSPSSTVYRKRINNSIEHWQLYVGCRRRHRRHRCQRGMCWYGIVSCRHGTYFCGNEKPLWMQSFLQNILSFRQRKMYFPSSTSMLDDDDANDATKNTRRKNFNAGAVHT